MFFSFHRDWSKQLFRTESGTVLTFWLQFVNYLVLPDRTFLKQGRCISFHVQYIKSLYTYLDVYPSQLMQSVPSLVCVVNPGRCECVLAVLPPGCTSVLLQEGCDRWRPLSCSCQPMWVSGAQLPWLTTASWGGPWPQDASTTCVGRLTVC